MLSFANHTTAHPFHNKHSNQPLATIVCSEEISFYGSVEEANSAPLYGSVHISHSLIETLPTNHQLKVRVMGTAKVCWDEECSYFAILASRKRLICEEITLPTLPPCSSSYSHTFPFEFNLDGHLPSSFHLENDYIKYWVDLVSVNGDQETVLANKPITITRCSLPPSEPSYAMGSESEPSSPSAWVVPSQEKLIGVHEDVQYCIMAPLWATLGDDFYQFKIIFRSLNAEEDLPFSQSFLTVSLHQQMECQLIEADLSPQMFSKNQNVTISRTSNNQKVQLKGQETALQVKLPLSGKLVEGLDCDLIRISHSVKVQIKFGRFFAKKLQLTFPLHVSSSQHLPPPYI
ncbi:hypothetical protein CONCODRAFT_78133, partial [Conidiobolus coronatus NRRL 28638]